MPRRAPVTQPAASRSSPHPADPALARLLSRPDPTHYYDAGEIAILRAYFGLKPRRSDPPLDALQEDDTASPDGVDPCDPPTGPVRLRTVEYSDGPVNPLSNAVARICLSSVQDRLPQWSTSNAQGDVLLARQAFPAPDRTFTPLAPQRVLCINWADSGPGFSWPEDYHVTLLPGFGRCVITASSDSTDSYGITDFAIGWFRASLDRRTGCTRVLRRWWSDRAANDGGAWEYLFDEGLLDRDAAYALRDRVWRHRDEY